MKFALMQPYFFPYIGYFSLIHSVDHFMFFDDVQFTRKSWMSRNRLLNIEKGEPFYIRPDIVKPQYRELLPDVKLASDEKWENRIIQQIKGYKNKAPYYTETVDLLEGLLFRDHRGLADFNINSTIEISKYLGIKTKFDRYTDHDFWFEHKPDIGDWGRVVAAEVKATEYINSPGGESFISPIEFSKLGIRLGFIEPKIEPYWQGEGEFSPGLSIIDVLLFNGREQTAELVKNYSVNIK
ncbi:WbqC family protein [Akkermansiaceae bacterium]|nr:WbqC family protein [Akkermansiaceae bacterium]